nr:hypothetical protein BaRGS_012341 [Batillaria attramentaria]
MMMMHLVLRKVSLEVSNLEFTKGVWLQASVMGVGTERNGGESPRSAAGEGPRTVTHDAGDTAVLYCSITDLGDLTVTWRKLPKSSPLTIGERTWVKDTRIHAEHVPNSTQWNLVIQNVNATDAGTYECQLHGSRFDKGQATVMLSE